MKNVDGPAVRLVDDFDDDVVDELPDVVHLALVGIAGCVPSATKSTPGSATGGRHGNAARSKTRTAPGDGGSHAAPTSPATPPHEVDAVADIINNQRCRNLDYQTPANLYAALTVQ